MDHVPPFVRRTASVDQLYTIRLALKAESELCLLTSDSKTECSIDLESNVVQELNGIRKSNGKYKRKKTKLNGKKNRVNNV